MNNDTPDLFDEPVADDSATAASANPPPPAVPKIAGIQSKLAG